MKSRYKPKQKLFDKFEFLVEPKLFDGPSVLEIDAKKTNEFMLNGLQSGTPYNITVVGELLYFYNYCQIICRISAIEYPIFELFLQKNRLGSHLPKY